MRLLLLLLSAACGLHAQTQPTLALDIARDSAGVGEPIELTLTSDEPLEGGRNWEWPSIAVGDSLARGWEVIELSPLDSSASPVLEAGLRRTQTLTIMAWDTGTKVIEPLSLKDSGGVASSTQAALVEVVPMLLEENPAPKPMQGFKAYRWTWWERLIQVLPWILALAVLILGGRWAYRKWKEKETAEAVEETAEVPSEPAHVLALRMLRTVEADAPWTRGEGKEAQAVLSEAVRLHLQGTFGVKALERTTDELSRTLTQSPVRGLPEEETQWILALLERSDLVKFAKQDMDGDAHLRVIRESIAWVERTPPLAETAEGNTASAPSPNPESHG
jgi:hypothetical protein